MSGEDALLAFELGAAVDGEWIGAGIFGVGAGVFGGAIEDVVGGEEDEWNIARGTGEGERAGVVGGFGPGLVGLALVDVGGAGGAEDGGDVVAVDEAIELRRIGGDAFEIEMQPVWCLRAASGWERGIAKLCNELRAELAGGAENEDATGSFDGGHEFLVSQVQKD